MKLDFLDLDKTTDSKTNMRSGRKEPDVADLVPSVRARGVLQPIIVRPQADTGLFEVVAGRRRRRAALIVAAEVREAGGDPEPIPAAIIEPGDDAAALEASMIENMARLDPDEVKQWESFTALVKKGRRVEDIAATFGLPEPMIRRVLALGNLLPRIRELYRRDEIDGATVRHLTMATKAKQQEWLALYDDPDAREPMGGYLKSWLLGGQTITTTVALFDVADFPGLIVTTLFADDAYFGDPEAFWTAQNAAIEARRLAYLEAGWQDVTILEGADYFRSWEYEKTSKRKGGHVVIEVRASGGVVFHEGYLSTKEAKKRERAEAGGKGSSAKIARPEVSSTMQTYVDLHRHSAVRADLLDHAGVALRMMLAHAIAGSFLWRVQADARTARNEDVAESAEGSEAEARFDKERREVLALLGYSDEELSITSFHVSDYATGGETLPTVFLRLLGLDDGAVMRLVAVVMGETLAAGSAAVEVLGETVGTDMARWWKADDAFFECIRDKEVLGRIVAEVAGEKGRQGERRREDQDPQRHRLRPSGRCRRSHEGRGLGAALDALHTVRLHRARRRPDRRGPRKGRGGPAPCWPRPSRNRRRSGGRGTAPRRLTGDGAAYGRPEPPENRGAAPLRRAGVEARPVFTESRFSASAYRWQRAPCPQRGTSVMTRCDDHPRRTRHPDAPRRLQPCAGRADLAAIGPILAPGAVLVAGTDSALISGRKAQLLAWKREFSAQHRAIYTRTPDTIIVSPVEPIAFEHGQWSGVGAADGVVQASGAFTAKWRQIGNDWTIEAELYLTLA